MTCKQWDGDDYCRACVCRQLEFEQSRHGMRSPLTGIIQHQALKKSSKNLIICRLVLGTGISMYKFIQSYMYSFINFTVINFCKVLMAARSYYTYVGNIYA